MAARKPAQRSTNGTVIDYCNEVIVRVKSVNSIVSSPESKALDLMIAMKGLGEAMRGVMAMGDLPGLDLQEWFRSGNLKDIPRPGA